LIKSRKTGYQTKRVFKTKPELRLLWLILYRKGRKVLRKGRNDDTFDYVVLKAKLLTCGKAGTLLLTRRSLETTPSERVASSLRRAQALTDKIKKIM
jgi:hypothetical protein